MLIAAVISSENPDSGGGSTFQQSILRVLPQASGEHEYVVIDMGEGGRTPDISIPYINLREYCKAADEAILSERNSIVKVLDRYRAGALIVKAFRRVRYVFRPRDPSQVGVSVENLLDDIVRDLGVDLVWFIIPHAQKVSVPFIFTVWDLQHRVQPYFPEVSTIGWQWGDRDNLYREFIPRAALTVTGTQVGKDEIIRYYSPNPQNVRVIPFPSPISKSDIEDSWDDSTILKRFSLSPGFLFYPAQFWAHKNHVTLLRALKLLSETYNINVDMVFTGSDRGNTAYVRELAKSSSKNIRFLGFVERREILALYRSAGALVYPSFFGPDNLPPLEAFSLRCPVIAARVDGAPEQLGDAAILFDPANPGELAKAIALLHENDVLRERLVNLGSEKCKDLTPARYVEEIGRFLDEFSNVRKCWA